MKKHIVTVLNWYWIVRLVLFWPPDVACKGHVDITVRYIFFGTYLVFSQLVHFFSFSLPRVAVESVACKGHVDITVRYFFTLCCCTDQQEYFIMPTINSILSMQSPWLFRQYSKLIWKKKDHILNMYWLIAVQFYIHCCQISPLPFNFRS
jgi:hypothetical protein